MDYEDSYLTVFRTASKQSFSFIQLRGCLGIGINISAQSNIYYILSPWDSCESHGYLILGYGPVS